MKKKCVLAVLLSFVTSCTLEEVVNRCGNGVLDLGEQCDGRLIDGDVWKASGYSFDYDSTYCSQFCQILKKTENQCGNGVLDEGEQCDGDAKDEKAWSESSYSIEYDSSYCTQKCTFAPISVMDCGNGVLDEGEQCDGDAVIENICGKGNIQIEYKSDMCSQTCQISNLENLCSSLNAVPCGNGVLDDDEQCDGNEYDEKVCGSDKVLDYEPSMCSEEGRITALEDHCKEPAVEAGCGNDIIEPDEECDGDVYDENICGPGEFELTYTPDVCSQKCKIVNLKDQCIIPDDKEYLKGGIASCSSRIEEKDGVIKGSIDLTRTKFAGDEPFEIGMECVNYLSVTMLVSIKMFASTPVNFSTTDENDHAEFELARSKFTEAGHYYCHVYVRGREMTVTDSEGEISVTRTAYFCGKDGEEDVPRDAVNIASKYNLGNMGIEELTFQYEFDVEEAE